MGGWEEEQEGARGAGILVPSSLRSWRAWSKAVAGMSPDPDGGALSLERGDSG